MAPPNRKEQQRRRAKMVDARKYLDDHGSEWKPTSYVVPEGLTGYRFEEPGLYMIDVVPYVVARHKDEPGGNPFVEEEDVGAMSYERTYYVHSGVGTDEKSYVCLHKEYKEDCPGCEYVQELLANPTIDRKKVVNPRRPKERQLFLFFDRTTKESRKKGLQFYECAHYMSFGELLKTTLEAYRLNDPNSEALNFADPEEGMTLAVTVKKTAFSSDSGRSGNYNKPVNIQFVPRDRPLPAEILEAAPCLDDVPARISYDKFYKLFHQQDARKTSAPGRDAVSRTPPARPKAPDDDDQDDDDAYDNETSHLKGGADEGDDEAPVAVKANRPTAERNGKKIPTAKELEIERGDEVEYDGDVYEVIHVSGDGTSLRLKDSEGEILMGVSVEDVEKVSEKLPRTKKGSPQPAAAPDDDQDDDDQDDESPKAGTVRGAGRKSAGVTKPSSGSRKAAVPTDDDDDDDDQDDDDQPAPAAKKGKGRL